MVRAENIKEYGPARMIDPIETELFGCKFRSRTEARWAIFFNLLDISYEYEPKRFALPSGETYLPDFFLPELGVYLEVKPDNDEIIRDEIGRCIEFEQIVAPCEVWVAIGSPKQSERNIFVVNERDCPEGFDHCLAVDRRDRDIYWLADVENCIVGGRLIGGKGKITDHDRPPIEIESAVFDKVNRFKFQ